MEDKKGSGIFLGVVSVATLIVAIIGATFAFFSASTNSNEDAVNLTAYEFNASLSVSQVYPVSAASLIPLNPSTVITNAQSPNNTNLLYALNTATNRCIDDAGFQVCALYQVVFTNNGSQAITLDGVLTTTTNNASQRTGASAFTNLTYAPVTLNSGSYTVGTPVTIEETVGDSINIAQLTVPANDSVTDYFVVYLNENGDQSAEMGASYQGQLVYTSTAGSGSQLTGTFTVSAPEPNEP